MKRKMKSKKKSPVPVLAVIILLVWVGMFAAAQVGDRKTALDTGGTDISADANIQVPGYDVLEFKAGTKRQTVMLNNPSQNECIFKLSLCLEDGSVLWASDELEPGCAFSRIRLNRALEEGVYKNSVLKYECFALADHRPLNGAQIILTIDAR